MREISTIQRFQASLSVSNGHKNTKRFFKKMHKFLLNLLYFPAPKPIRRRKRFVVGITFAQLYQRLEQESMELFALCVKSKYELSTIIATISILLIFAHMSSALL